MEAKAYNTTKWQSITLILLTVTFPPYCEQTWLRLSNVAFVPQNQRSGLLPRSILQRTRDIRGSLTQIKPRKCKSLLFKSHTTLRWLAISAVSVVSVAFNFPLHITDMQFALYKGELDDFFYLFISGQQLPAGDPGLDQRKWRLTITG